MDPSVSLLRHATLVVELGDQRIVVDPMLDAPGARGPVANTPNDRRNPLVALPAGAQKILAAATTAVVTHLHADHLDAAGARFLQQRAVPTFGQPEDLAALAERGVPVAGAIGTSDIGSVAFTRTPAQHAREPDLIEHLGPVSGVVLSHGDHSVYVGGDTVRFPGFDATMREHSPAVAVLNAGGARFIEGEPITMTAADIVGVARNYPDCRIVAVHMDAINHCLDTRADLRAALDRAGVANVVVPADGERVAI